jgi:hypothetical protein
MRRGPEFYAGVLGVLVAFAGVAYATDQVHVRVKQYDNQQTVPRAAVDVSGPGALNSLTADDVGILTLNVPPYVVGSSYTFAVNGWFVISPCDLERGRTVLPNPASEPVAIMVLHIGDQRLKGTVVGCMLVERAADFGSNIGPSPRRAEQRERTSIERRRPYVQAFGFLQADVAGVSGQTQWEAYLDRQAKELSFPRAELRDAIDKWAKSASGPYDKGLAALYHGSYEEASRLFGEAIESPERKAKGSLANKLICRARAEHELGRYDAAESDLLRLLAIDKANKTVGRDLDIVRKKKKQSFAVQGTDRGALASPHNAGVKAQAVPTPASNIPPAGAAAPSPGPKLELESEIPKGEKETGLGEAPGIGTKGQPKDDTVESPKKRASKRKPTTGEESEPKKETEHNNKKKMNKKKTEQPEE